MNYTIHAVLAGAYAGKVPLLLATLTHASIDGGNTAVCRRVRAGNLCDQEERELTCVVCLQRVKQLGRTPANG